MTDEFVTVQCNLHRGAVIIEHMERDVALSLRIGEHITLPRRGGAHVIKQIGKIMSPQGRLFTLLLELR